MSCSKAKASAYKLNCRTAIISISNILDEPVHFPNSKYLIAMLPLTFNDVSGREKFCMDEKVALQIKEFVDLISNKVDRLIVHCEFGVSRSAGIAAAILKAISGNDSAIFDDPKYVPNMHCYRLVMDALMDEEGNLTINPFECVYSSICVDDTICRACPKYSK